MFFHSRADVGQSVTVIVHVLFCGQKAAGSVRTGPFVTVAERKNRVPGVRPAAQVDVARVLVVCGMSMMINLAVETGIADLMGGWLGSNLPTMLVIPVIVLLAGLLSFITTGPAVIFPLFIPMFPALSAATGISVIALTAALFAGTGATGMSPFSQGGAMAITGCKDEKVRESLWSKQLIFAGIFLLFYIVFGFCGFFNAVASIFA